MISIAVWNTAFLGDAILPLPLLQSLRRGYPEATIHFWVRAGFKTLFAAHPAVNAVFEYDKRGSEKGIFQAARLGRKLAKERYSLWIAAHGSLRSALIARWSNAARRIGYSEPRVNSWFYTHTVPRRFSERDEIERLLALLDPLHLAERESWPRIVLPDTVRTEAAELLSSVRGLPLLGMHPGSVWGTKRWPTAYFAAIGREALRHGARVVLFGGPGEEQQAAEVRAELRGEIRNNNLLDLSGALSLPLLAGVIGLLDCYLTNDSGPMHLAWPQNVPVTALFGPTVRELGFFPRGEKADVMEIPLECRPCSLHGPTECPRGHHRCMRDLTPDTVWPGVRAKLFGGSI